jgi:hypothetical protein
MLHAGVWRRPRIGTGATDDGERRRIAMTPDPFALLELLSRDQLATAARAAGIEVTSGMTKAELSRVLREPPMRSTTS